MAMGFLDGGSLDDPVCYSGFCDETITIERSVICLLCTSLTIHDAAFLFLFFLFSAISNVRILSCWI